MLKPDGSSPPGRLTFQTLFIDADDTLWENNVYFEAVVAQYCELLAARGLAPDFSRGALLAIERERTKTHGYGISSFTQAMRVACRELLGDDHAVELATIEEHCAGIRRQSMEILPGVPETLRVLSQRHRLILLTKGDPSDQLDKLHRSGLRAFLHDVDVVPEKNVGTYEDALARHGTGPDAAWMIGNSPKSDVLPALAAGLGVVFIPHAVTWILELQELPEAPADRFLKLERFDQLTDYF
jgi:putative hydrolase of the HAD superfamily